MSTCTSSIADTLSDDTISEIEKLGKQLEEKLKKEGRLEGKEAELYWEYSIYRTKKWLSTISKPVAPLFRDILALYGVNLPVYIVPHYVIILLSDRDAVGYYWVDKTTSPHKPLGILIASDKVKEGYKNVQLARLKTLLHEIGHHLLYREAREFAEKWLERYSNRLNDHKFADALCAIIEMGIENRIEKWVKEEWRKLRKFINYKYDGWKKGVSLEHLKKYIGPDKCINPFR